MLQLQFADMTKAPVALTKGRIRLGRRPDNDVVVSDPSVAEVHAELMIEQGGVTLDPGAGVRTFINDEPVSGRMALGPGDRLRLGDVEFRLVEARASGATATRPPPADWSLVAKDTGKAVDITSNLMVGRQPDCGLTIPDERVSRNHARLSIQDGALTVEDLGSTNGTWINGERTAKRTLKDGDEVAFDRYRFRVVHQAAVREQALPAAARRTVFATQPVGGTSAAAPDRREVPEPAAETPRVPAPERAPASAELPAASAPEVAAASAAQPAASAPPAQQAAPVEVAARREAPEPVAERPGSPAKAPEKSPERVSASAAQPVARAPAPEVIQRKTKWWERASMGPRRTMIMPGGEAKERALKTQLLAPTDVTGPVLVGLSKVVEGRRIELRPGTMLVGRSPQSDAVIDDALVSDKHAQLVFENGSVSIVSLPNCTNGTFVNRARAGGRVYLNSGDVVSFGGVDFQLWLPGRSGKAKAGRRARASWAYTALGFLVVLVIALALILALR